MASGGKHDFFDYFKANMEALGLDVPSTLFNTQSAASIHIGAMLTAFKVVGKDATVSELIGATTGLEKLIVMGALRAMFYVGAAIGSFAVATGRYAAHGASISDVMMEIHQHGITPPPWLYNHLALHPEILDQRHLARFAYAFRARK